MECTCTLAGHVKSIGSRHALDTQVNHAHGVWHLFVITGSATHYYAILRHVL